MGLATVPEAIAEIKAGKLVIVVDDEDRENEGDLTMAAELCGADDIGFFRKHASGVICVPMTASRLEELDLPQMVARNEARWGTAFTVSVDAREGITTGISAADRAQIAVGVRDSRRPPCGIPAAHRTAGLDEIGGDPATGLTEAEHCNVHQPSTISRSPFRL
jgi:3,4-dihydroxy 2-butanone 4-phosphate synthase/GTP cyclohydrolase II